MENITMMTNDCKTCPVSTGTHKPAEAVHQIAEPQAEAMRLADECDESATNWVHEIDTRFKAAKMLRAQHTRIAELESELEAVGAGGVEPLRKQTQLAEVQQGVPSDAEIGQAIDGFDWEGWIDQRKALRTFVKECLQRFKTTHPTQQGLDAQRWQIVHDHISGEYIAGRACFVVHVQPMSGANIMRGSVAEHFTKAVDDIAAQIKIAAQAKQGGEA